MNALRLSEKIGSSSRQWTFSTNPRLKAAMFTTCVGCVSPVDSPLLMKWQLKNIMWELWTVPHLYLLNVFSHDWPDADCVKIFQQVQKAMGPNSRVLIRKSFIGCLMLVTQGLNFQMNTFCNTPTACPRTKLRSLKPQSLYFPTMALEEFANIISILIWWLCWIVKNELRKTLRSLVLLRDSNSSGFGMSARWVLWNYVSLEQIELVIRHNKQRVVLS